MSEITWLLEQTNKRVSDNDFKFRLFLTHDFEYRMDIFMVFYSHNLDFFLTNQRYEVTEDNINYIWINYFFNGAIAQSILGMNSSRSPLKACLA